MKEHVTEHGRCVCTYMLEWHHEDRIHIHLLLYSTWSVKKMIQKQASNVLHEDY